MFEVLTFEPRTLSWWFDERENIELNPPYQRQGHLWSEQDRRFLLDSILNGYDLPKVYVADFTFGNSSLNSGGKQYAVIDGKQRLLTIFEFFDGHLTLDPDFVWDRNQDLKLGGLSYKDLLQNHPKVASKFANFPLSVMRVITDDEAKINEMFVRLNKGKPLTGAELRNAMGGIVPDLIRQISENPFMLLSIKFSTKRRQADNVSAKLLLIEFRGRLVETKKVSLDRFVEEGLNSEAQTEDFVRAKDRVIANLNKLFSVFLPLDPLLRSQGPVTVYYWLVRELESAELTKLRVFLTEFEAARKHNRLEAKRDDGNVDAELADYDFLDRSTNDQASLEKRFEILRRRFNEWLKKV